MFQNKPLIFWSKLKLWENPFFEICLLPFISIDNFEDLRYDRNNLENLELYLAAYSSIFKF